MSVDRSEFLNRPFAAGHVGSLPRPQAVRDMLPEHPGPESVDAARSKQMDAAVGYAVALQETAGLDLVSDGEWRRHAYTHVIADIASGFSPDPEARTLGHHRHRAAPGRAARTDRRGGPLPGRGDGPRYQGVHTVPVSTGGAAVGRRAVRRRLPYPRLVHRGPCAVLHREAELLAGAGVSVVQIDEPHLCVLVDPGVRATFEDPQYEMDLAADKINEVLHGISGPRTALHLCRRNWGRAGWGAEGGYGPIIESMKRIEVDQYVMEFSIPAAGDLAILKEMPEESLIGLGCVECRFEKIDTPEEIVARVEEALKYVEPERLSLNPDCGFSPGRASEVPLEEAYLKLRNEVEAACRLREKYA